MTTVCASHVHPKSTMCPSQVLPGLARSVKDEHWFAVLATLLFRVCWLSFDSDEFGKEDVEVMKSDISNLK